MLIIKKVTFIILAVAMILNYSLIAEANEYKIYRDIKGHWAEEEIISLIEKDIYNEFSEDIFLPNNKITRAELAKLIVKANLPINYGGKQIGFVDTEGHPLESYINLAQSMGKISGYEDNTFRPDNFATREELVTMLTRNNKEIQEIAKREVYNFQFTDVSDNRWSYEFINYGFKAGLIKGYEDGTFRPLNNVTKAEAYTFMHRYYNILNPIYEQRQGINIINTYGERGINIIPIQNLNNSEKYNVNITSNNGGHIVLGESGQYAYNSQIDIEARSISNYEFSHWSSSNGGTFSNRNSQRTTFTTPNSDTTITAIFVESNNTGGDNNNNGGGGNNGGNDGGGSGDFPVIKIITPFPDETTTSVVDIEYEVMIDSNAYITEVFYEINNNNTPNYIYHIGNEVVEPIGILGQGRVLLLPGTNEIVFTVKDSLNRTNTFTVPTKSEFNPYSSDAYVVAPREPSQYIKPSYLSSEGIEITFASRRLSVYGHIGVTEEQIEEAIQLVNGTIVGKRAMMYHYDIQVEDSTEEELKQMAQILEEQFPDIISSVNLAYHFPFELDVMPSDYVDEISQLQEERPPTNDPWWFPSSSTTEWGLTAINVPQTWEKYQRYMRNIPVGVLDSAFLNSLEDLQVPDTNIKNRKKPTSSDMSHGTHVMGTIGATHNNSTGIAGATNINRDSLFGYDVFNPELTEYQFPLLKGLWDLVIHGSNVINASIGTDFELSQPQINYINQVYPDEINRLLNLGYDFVIVNSAGNATIDAGRSGSFRVITQPDIKDIIIVVGASDQSINLTNFTNYGDRVDVLAPGVNIYSTGYMSISHYHSIQGTSMAAPHVALE